MPDRLSNRNIFPKSLSCQIVISCNINCPLLIEKNLFLFFPMHACFFYHLNSFLHVFVFFYHLDLFKYDILYFIQRNVHYQNPSSIHCFVFVVSCLVIYFFQFATHPLQLQINRSFSSYQLLIHPLCISELFNTQDTVNLDIMNDNNNQ